MADITRYAPWFSRPVSEVQADLESFAALLRRWNSAQNLVSRETEANLWERHIVDSLQVLPFLDQPAPSVLDVGSGGGLPALPLAIALKGSGSRFTLAEPLSKKVSFLRTVIRELHLPAVVHAGRVEGIDSRETSFDVITSRALAQLRDLLALVHPFFTEETVAILHKGKDHAVELAESRLAWDFDVISTNSVTDGRGVLLRIKNLRPRSGV